MMTRLLRSPFSWMVDRGIVLLTVTGRRTGAAYRFPVQYVRDGSSLWVMTGGHEGKSWWRNVVGGAPVEVLLRRRPLRGAAIAFEPGEHPDVVEDGIRRYVERFPRMAKRLGISSEDPDSFAAVAARTVMVRIDLAES
jgi:deazaflavin-dependent oxidoreductase (nitroreductase family)